MNRLINEKLAPFVMAKESIMLPLGEKCIVTAKPVCFRCDEEEKLGSRL